VIFSEEIFEIGSSRWDRVRLRLRAGSTKSCCWILQTTHENDAGHARVVHVVSFYNLSWIPEIQRSYVFWASLPQSEPFLKDWEILVDEMKEKKLKIKRKKTENQENNLVLYEKRTKSHSYGDMARTKSEELRNLHFGRFSTADISYLEQNCNFFLVNIQKFVHSHQTGLICVYSWRTPTAASYNRIRHFWNSLRGTAVPQKIYGVSANMFPKLKTALLMREQFQENVPLCVSTIMERETKQQCTYSSEFETIFFDGRPTIMTLFLKNHKFFSSAKTRGLNVIPGKPFIFIMEFFIFFLFIFFQLEGQCDCKCRWLGSRHMDVWERHSNVWKTTTRYAVPSGGYC